MIEPRYHSCINCPGYWFMPCGCEFDVDTCSVCEEDQAHIKLLSLLSSRPKPKTIR